MLGMLRKFGWIGGLATLARTPMGREVTARVKAYANHPATRRKVADLRSKYLAAARTR